MESNPTELTANAFKVVKEACLNTPSSVPTIVLQYLGPAFSERFIELSDGEFKETFGLYNSLIEQAKGLQKYDIIECLVKFRSISYSIVMMRVLYRNVPTQIGNPRQLSDQPEEDPESMQVRRVVDRRIPASVLAQNRV